MTETREGAAEYIRRHPERYLEPAKMRGTYVCPLCKNGTGRTGDGITTRDGIHFTCWKCHGIESNDIIDIIGLVEGISDDRDKFNRAYDIYGIDIDDSAYKTEKVKPAEVKEVKQMQKKVYNFNAEVEKAHKALLDTPAAIKHFTDRGIDIETIKRYKLGYAPEGYNSFLSAYPEKQAKSNKADLYKYILPYIDAEGNYTYFQAEICDREQIDEYNPKYRYINNQDRNTPKQIFNERYITPEGAGVIFICEGVYDALSVESAGYKAIGGIDTGYTRLIDRCRDTQTDAVFILATDNDDAGENATEKRAEELTSLGIPFILAPAASGKDYNDFIRADREGFISFIGEKVREAERIKDREKAEALAEYNKASAAEHLSLLEAYIELTSKERPISTGFTELDAILGDGIRNGLYIIGAISSLGKTSFCVQLCDNMAKDGRDIIFYSLEMPEREIIAKSLSRESFNISLEKTGDNKTAKTTLKVMNGREVNRYTASDIETIAEAKRRYLEYAGHIRIIEVEGKLKVSDIETDILKHKALTGNTPIVFVDYLQILSEANINKTYTDKQKVDDNIVELKRLSRNTPIIAISSFNRENYLEPVSLSAFKESGNVEYASDVLLALQYAGMDYTDEKETERKKRIRDLLRQQAAAGRQGQAQDIELKVLKNRNGSRGDVSLYFYPMFNYFRGRNEATAEDNPFKPEATQIRLKI